MHQVQLDYLKVKTKWDLAMEQLRAGVKNDELLDELDALENELLDAEDALRDWVMSRVMPILKSRGITEKDVIDVFTYKTEEAIDLALRLRV